MPRLFPLLVLNSDLHIELSPGPHSLLDHRYLSREYDIQGSSGFSEESKSISADYLADLFKCYNCNTI